MFVDYPNLEKEIENVPNYFIPYFGEVLIKKAWEIFQELIKERCVPPERRIQQNFAFQDSGWMDSYLRQTWFHPEEDQIYQPMPQQKQQMNPQPLIPGNISYKMNPFQWIEQMKVRFNCFLESFKLFCYDSKLDYKEPKNLQLYQEHLRFCRKKNLHPDDFWKVKNFKENINFLFGKTKKDSLFVTENEMKNIIQKYKNEKGISTKCDIINVTITSISGFSVVIPTPGYISFKDLFLIFAHKTEISENAIENKIEFLYNYNRLDIKSTNPINSLFKDSNAKIMVFPQSNVIGTKYP